MPFARQLTFSLCAIFLVTALLVIGTGGCLGDVEVPPDPPSLFPVQSPTRSKTQLLEGTKPMGTAVLNHGQVIAARNESESWSAEISLVPGENLISLTCQNANGLESKETVEAVIVFEPNFPAQPSVDQVLSPTNVLTQTIAGTKPMASALVLDSLDAGGQVSDSLQIIALGDETEWSHPLQLQDQEGVQRFSLRAVDGGDKASEPFDFSVEVDRIAPTIISAYPLSDEAGVPRNSLISVGFDAPLDLSISQVDQSILTLQDDQGTPVGGTLIYNPVAPSLVLAVPMQANTVYEAQLDGSRFTDAAGNSAVPQPVEWTWSFTTSDQTVDSNPAAPSLVLPAQVDGDGHTTAKAVLLSGSKPALSSIWINGREAVALTAGTDWDKLWNLAPGNNDLAVTARNLAGLVSPATQALVV